MLAEGQHDPDTIEIFTTNYLEPARRNLRLMLRHVVDGGIVQADFDVEMAIDVTFGTLYHQLLLRRTLEQDWVDRLSDFVFRGALIEPAAEAEI